MSRRAHRHLIAGPALGARPDVMAPGDEHDLAVAGIDQQLRRGACPAEVVHEHRVGAGASDLAIEPNDRDAEVEQSLELRGFWAGRREDRASHSLIDEHLDVGALLVGALVGVAHEDGVPLAIRQVLDGSHHLREVRVLDVRDDHGDAGAVLLAQVARQAVGPVLELRDGCEDALAVHVADLRIVVEHARHGRHRHRGGAGDVSHRVLLCSGFVRNRFFRDEVDERRV